jgi:hypothetical protein
MSLKLDRKAHRPWFSRRGQSEALRTESARAKETFETTRRDAPPPLTVRFRECLHRQRFRTQLSEIRLREHSQHLTLDTQQHNNKPDRARACVPTVGMSNT